MSDLNDREREIIAKTNK